MDETRKWATTVTVRQLKISFSFIKLRTSKQKPGNFSEIDN